MWAIVSKHLVQDNSESSIYASECLEAVVQMCSVKNRFLEISQNSQENNCAIVSFLLKLQALHKLVILSKIIISFVEDSL